MIKDIQEGAMVMLRTKRRFWASFTAAKYYKEQEIGKPKGSPTITKDNSKAGLSKKSKKKDS